MQSEDVKVTCTGVSELVKDFGFKPSKNLNVELKKFTQ